MWDGWCVNAICHHVQLLTLAKACNRVLMCAVLSVSLSLWNRSLSARRGEDEKWGGTVTRLGGHGPRMSPLGAGLALHPLSCVPIYVSAGGCPLPTLQAALLATLYPGESISFECAHVGLMSDRERERICFVWEWRESCERIHLVRSHITMLRSHITIMRSGPLSLK